MHFPKINKQPMQTVGVPKMSGGLNLRDAITAVEDNQLTDSLNMWFDDNILKTRPALRYMDGKGYPSGIDKVQKENVTRTENGKFYKLISYLSGNSIYFCFIGEDGIKTAFSPIFGGENRIENYFAVQFRDKIYCFVEQNECSVYVLNGTWDKLCNEEMYAPIVMAHCKTTGGFSASDEVLKAAGGVMLEGYNLLGDRYRMIYSTVNKDLLKESDPNSSHTMNYPILHGINVGDTVTAIITSKSGTTYTHSVTAAVNGWNTETENNGDNIYLSVCALGRENRGQLCFKTSGGDTASVKATDYLEDNMELILPCPNDRENLKKVFGMTKSVWFGGDAAGISGGSRLFLCGNTYEKEGSLLLWSGLNEPLYFPENCYSYVGNSKQKITALGRQNDTLVIFKERETFYTQYVRNSNITAENLINQSVVDYTASNVYFPIIQLNTAIGCDCPDTVELCRNRLVWTCSDGSVYTLITENQYSERNIYRVSDMIKRRLKAEADIKNAYSCDRDGHYYLFIGGHAYVMNYESYGYVYSSSYNKTADAQKQIPWWYWEFPSNTDNKPIMSLMCDNSLISLYNTVAGESKAICLYVLDEALNADEVNGKHKIQSMLLTKIFDFRSPHMFKNVPLVNVSFGNNGGEPITVSVVTENGESDEEKVILAESGKDEYSPEFVHNRQFRPCVRLINRIGIKIKCDGAMSIDSISLNYRPIGGAR